MGGTPEVGVQAELGGLGVGVWVKNVSGHPFERFWQAIIKKIKTNYVSEEVSGVKQKWREDPDGNLSETPCA